MARKINKLSPKIAGDQEAVIMGSSENPQSRFVDEMRLIRQQLSKLTPERDKSQVWQRQILRQRAIMAAFNELFKKTLSCNQVSEVAHICLEITQALTGSTWGLIGLVDSTGDVVPSAFYDAERLLADTSLQTFPWIDFFKQQGILDQLLTGQKTIIVNNLLARSPGWQPAFTAILGTPLGHSGKVIGILILGKKADGYGLDDEQDLQALAEALAEVLQRMQLEEVITRQKRDYLAIFDSVPSMIFYINDKRRVIRANQAAAKALGLKVTQIAGKSFEELFSQEGLAKIFNEDAGEVSQTGQPVDSREISLNFLGEWRWVEVDKIHYYDSDHQLAGTVIIITDITQRREAEAALKAERQRLFSLLDKLPGFVSLRSPDYTIPYANRLFVKIFGDPRGKTCFQTQHGRQEPCEDCPTFKVFSTNEPHEREWQHPHGQAFKIYNYPFTEPNDTPQILQLGIDITEQKRNAELFRNLIMEAPIGIFIVQKGKFMLINPSLQEITGYAKEDLLGKDSSFLIAPEFRESVRQKTIAMLKHEDTSPYEFKINTKTGETKWILQKASNIPYQGKNSTLGFFMDITALKQEEEKLARAYDRLKIIMEETVGSLAAAMEQRDPYTAGHQLRVAKLADAIARKIGLPEERVEGIRLAGLVHDIGKLYVPSELLSKPTKLNEIEMSLIKLHSQAGHDILRGIEFAWPVVQTVLQHHERLDGSGYPRGLTASDIAIEARIMAVADVVEAMSTHRPYRPALGIEAALKEISKNKGIIFDSQVVDACIELFTKDQFSFS